MATKLKSFEQFVAEMDRAEEIEKTEMELGTPDSKGTEEVEDEASTVQHEELEAEEEVEDSEEVSSEEEVEMDDDSEEDEDEDSDEDEDDDEDSEEDKDEDDDEDSEEDEVVEEAEEVEEDRAEEIEKEIKDKGEPKMLADILTELYEGACKNEAKAYEEDAHDEHTVESYMKENAALVAGLMAKTLREMKDDYAIEAYEAACNEMIEAYSKKIGEMKETDSAADASDVSAE
jgi:hypothetical protein